MNFDRIFEILFYLKMENKKMLTFLKLVRQLILLENILMKKL